MKDGNAKRIYINGKLFLEGTGDALKTDFTTLVLGGGPTINDNRIDGFLDDFAVYSGALTEAQALSLAGGAAPSSVTGLVALWDFNDAPASNVRLVAARSGNQITVTTEPAALPSGWTLQSAPSLSGPWTPLAGTPPVTLPVDGDSKFVRAVRQ